MSHYVGGKFFILLEMTERMVYWIINKKIYFIKIRKLKNESKFRLWFGLVCYGLLPKMFVKLN